MFCEETKLVCTFIAVIVVNDCRDNTNDDWFDKDDTMEVQTNKHSSHKTFHSSC